MCPPVTSRACCGQETLEATFRSAGDDARAEVDAQGPCPPLAAQRSATSWSHDGYSNLLTKLGTDQSRETMGCRASPRAERLDPEFSIADAARPGL